MDTQTTAPGTSADRAGAVKQETTTAASEVASTVTEEAKRVTSDAKHQVRHLMGQTRTDLQEQAAAQQSRAATGLRELADQLREMAGSSDSDGMARGLVDDVARRAGEAASWLDSRDPGGLLDEARGFARRRPGTFLALAAGVGVLAGRLSRSLLDEARDDSGQGSSMDVPAGAGSPLAHSTPGSYDPLPVSDGMPSSATPEVGVGTAGSADGVGGTGGLASFGTTAGTPSVAPTPGGSPMAPQKSATNGGADGFSTEGETSVGRGER